MSLDPWAALESRRQRRHWRRWPWGWLALGLSVTAWGCAFTFMLLVMASVGMPGDGSHAMQATRIPMLVTLIVSAFVLAGAVLAGALSLRLARQPAGGICAIALLALLLACMLLPALL